MRVTVTSIIKQISQNLRDRYKSGFPIIKELIQNADDAFATRLDLILIPNGIDAPHPLLQGPALLAINDGILTNEDSLAINSIGYSSKTGNPYAIGRYGLGLKSIFHLCEAFFFISSLDHTLQIVNPWAEPADKNKENDPKYPEWDQISQADSQAVQDQIQNLIEDFPQYLCLWIPLRKTIHYDRRHPIIREFPGEQEVDLYKLLLPSDEHTPGLEVQLSRLLPQLRYIKALHGYQISRQNNVNLVFSVTLENGFSRFTFPEIAKNKLTKFGGQVNIQITARRKMTAYYSGAEMLLGDPVCDQLRESDIWPTHTDEDTVMGMVERKDNAHPHIAAIFSKYPGGSETAGLHIQNAVYLPLEKNSEWIPMEGSGSFGLTLHGWFFVDAGRLDVLGWDYNGDRPASSTEEITLTWNGRLAQKGTLPTLLVALENFVEDASLSSSEVERLTKALMDSNLFQKYQSYICREKQWVYCYAGSENSRWKLLFTGQPILELPKPPETDQDRPFKVFPQVHRIGLVTIQGKPRLSMVDVSKEWSLDQIDQLLASVPVLDVFSSESLLKYLLDFLEDCVAAQTRQTVLLNIAQQAFSKIDINTLRKNRELVKKFCAYLADNNWFVLPVQENFRETEAVVYLELFKLHLDQLIVPRDFSDRAFANQNIHLPTAIAVLQALGNEIAGNDLPGMDEVRTNFALYIFEHSENFERLAAQCGNLPLFRARNIHSDKTEERNYSLAELRQHRQNNRLYLFSSNGSEGILRDLSTALVDGKLTLIKKSTNDALKLETLESNETGCIPLLASKPLLNRPENRIRLLRLLLPVFERAISIQKIELQRIIRFLLHENVAQFETQDYLFVVEGEPTTWTRLTQTILASCLKSWLVIHPILSQEIATGLHSALLISTANEYTATNLIRNLTPEQLDALDFSELDEEDRNRILIDLSRKNQQLLPYLRIHETIGGEFAHLEPGTYLDNGFPLPDGLAVFAKLLKTPESHQIEAIYRELEIFPLSHEAVIQLALNSPAPSTYFITVLDALIRAEKLMDQTRIMLRETEWLPAEDYHPIPPNTILHLNRLEKDISQLLKKVGSNLISLEEVNDQVTSHPGIEKLVREVLPSTAEVLSLLGEILQHKEEYRIGLVESDRVNDEIVGLLIDAFSEQEDDELLPIFKFIKKVRDNLGALEALKLSRLICLPVQVSRLVNVLNHLSRVHESVSQDRKAKFTRLFNLYLELASKTPDFKSSILPNIRLLNGNSRWKSTKNLAYQANGIALEDLLSNEHARVMNFSFRHRESSNGGELEDIGGNYAEDLNESKKLLGNYFAEWEPYIQNLEVLGGFLCLLGEQMRGLAEKYLGQRGVDETREILDWMVDVEHWHPHENVLGRMSRQFFWVKVVETGTKTVPIQSLAGVYFDAKLEEDFEHLLFESPPPPSIRKNVYDYLCLRKVNLEEISPERRLLLIKNTAQIILRQVYYQDISNIDDFWKELEHSEQLDIEIAQDTILENAFSYIPSLGLGTHQYFHSFIKKWENNRTREIQARKNAQTKGKTFNFDTYEKEKEILRAVIKNIFEARDEKAHAACQVLLNAIRTRIGDEYQYKTESILFELFQNADDAVVELGVLFESSKRSANQEKVQCLSNHHKRVVVDWDLSRVRFAHWGRAINQIHPGDGERYGYESDLVKMLMMLRSDKRIALDLGIAPLTGKFGLGFKSVYLVTSQPAIISGRLRFKISSGLYPARLQKEEADSLTEVLSGWSIDRNQAGTLIDLPIDPEIEPSVSSQAVIEKFYQWSHLLLAFTQEINQIELRYKNTLVQSVYWNPQRVCDELDWFIGKMQSSKSNPPGLLVWKHGKKDSELQGSIMFAIGPAGCIPLSSETPKLWVTVPTQDQLPIKFALNGQFALDIGRAQLARSSNQNRTLAEDLGKIFGISLLGLYEYTFDHWETFKKLTELSPELSFKQFWKSFWKVACELEAKPEINVGTDLVSRILGSKHAGVEHLYHKAAALPSGLPGSYDVLTQIGLVRYWVSETLGRQDIFEKVSQWPEFQAKVETGEVVSKKVRDSLSFWLKEYQPWIEITLWEVINWTVGEKGRVNPAQARLLGELITPEFINNMDRSERESLQLMLRKLEFMTNRGDYRAAMDLLTPIHNLNEEHEVDEFRRSRFAPIGWVVSKEYQSQAATAFFRACRDRLSAPIEKMVEWILYAKDDERKIAALDYLLEGNQAGKLAAELLNNSRTIDFRNSWLAELSADHDLLRKFDFHEKNRILNILKLIPDSTQPPHFPPSPLPIRALLNHVYEWWENCHDELISDYEQEIYPSGSPRQLCVDTSLLDNLSLREEWLILFSLGSAHRVGRMHSTTYRNFSEFCIQQGWFRTFSNPGAEPQNWIDILDNYLDLISEDNDLKYQYLFVRQFVDIYNLSHHLNLYVEILQSINRMQARFPLEQIAIPNENEAFSGAGYPLMPKLTSTLGKGLNFTLRELVRRGVITSQFAFEHCYAPVPRLQNLFIEYGISDSLNTSTEIYQFLSRHLGNERATFMNSFDIPFLMIREQFGSFAEFLQS